MLATIYTLVAELRNTHEFGSMNILSQKHLTSMVINRLQYPLAMLIFIEAEKGFV